jgi:hypothetical protein
MEQSLRDKQMVTQTVKKFPAFMEPEDSLLCSQGPTTGFIS